MYGVRKRASQRELSRRLEWIAEDLRRAGRAGSEEEVYELAAARLEDECREDPRMSKALNEWAPSSRAPDRGSVEFYAELAATCALPTVSTLLRQIALSPSRRGPLSSLSGAAAGLMLMASRGGSSIVRQAYEDLKGSPAASWALAHPKIDVGLTQFHKQIIALTGRTRPGHDPRALVPANLALIRQLRALTDQEGRPKHPLIGQVGIVDATFMPAPVEQGGPNSPQRIQALRRAGMDLVDMGSHKKKRNEYRTVTGWIAATIVDLATSLPLVWVVASASAAERTVLLEQLLPLLFKYWPDCPMHTLIGDAGYEGENVCRVLEDHYSLHPVFMRGEDRETTNVGRGQSPVKVINGQPYCRCGPMKLRSPEGFYKAAERLSDGVPRGAPTPKRREPPRVRWSCPNGLCREQFLWVAQDPRDHTFWPRGGDSRRAYIRRALEVRRTAVESQFGIAKHYGIGVHDGRPLWARDTGITWLLGLHYVGRSAKRVVHETGAYALLLEEFRALGFDKPRATPSLALDRQHRQRRPPHLQFTWPQPARAEWHEHRAA
jgi:Transposase DDE domain